MTSPVPSVALSVTFNNEHTIDQMLESLAQQDPQPVEVIVVDNGSTDETVRVAEEALRRHELVGQVVRSTNTGFAGGYEVARRHVSTDGQILCINPDVKLAPGTLSLLVEASRLPGVAMATVPLVNLLGEEDTASRRRLPRLGSASAYAVLGRLLPARLRYNSLLRSAANPGPTLSNETATSRVEATTGALMMFSTAFRTRETTLFDLDYWMYGEDLQLCLDAAELGLSVLIVETEPSLHIKGASSGLPRSRRSDRAFHDALFLYYQKNLARNGVERVLVRSAIEAKYCISRFRSRLAGRPAA